MEKNTGMSPSQIDQAIEHDYIIGIIKVIGVCVTVIVLVLLAGITYCGSRPKQLDPNHRIETDAQTQIELRCIQTGGSWMPVITDASRNPTKYEMSCVKPDAQGIVDKMNNR